MPNNVPKMAREEGLEKYLDATKGFHNDLGYKEFVEQYDNPNIAVTLMATNFDVSRPTIYDWIDLHEKESTRNA